jgi:hypothetical protein
MTATTRVQWNPDYYLKEIPFDSMVNYLGISPRSLRAQIRSRRTNINTIVALHQRLNPLKEDPNPPPPEKYVGKFSDEQLLVAVKSYKTKYAIRKNLGVSSCRLENYLIREYGNNKLDNAHEKLGVFQWL